MAKAATWKVLAWASKQPPPAPEITLQMCCPNCGVEAALAMTAPGCVVIGTVGLSVVFDSPSFKPATNFMPDVIQCRACRKIFSGES